MDEEVTKWLKKEDLGDLTEIFTSQKINSMKRLLALNEELIKELIPQIGLRAGFLNSWKNLIKNMSIVQREQASKEISKVIITNNTPTFTKSVVDVPQEIVLSHSVEHTDLKEISKSVSNLDSNPVNQEPLSILNLDSNQECKRKQLQLKKSISKTGEKQRRRNMLSFKSTKKLTALNFKILLENYSLNSNAALQNFEKTGMLRCTDRSAIIEAVANIMFYLNNSPTALEYNIAAIKLCTLFPGEIKETYYCPPTNKYRFASGKLPNKIKYIKYQKKKETTDSGTTTLLDSSIVASENQITHSVKFAGNCDPNNSVIKTAIAHLKYDNIESWPERLRSWSMTRPLRFQYLKETRPILQQKATSSTQQFNALISDYFKNLNVLTLPKGYLLIQQDFKELYPGKEDGLKSKWNSIKEVLINFLYSEIAKSDEYGRKLLTDLTVIDTDKNDVALFHLLPSLCCKRTRGASVDMPSVAEARKAFILHVLIPEELNCQIKAHNDWLTNRGLNFQPTLVFVGPTLSNITASYVQIDTVRYELNTPLKALDTCFKAFHALNIAYQEECQAVWLFIQKYFYNLHLKEDKDIPQVTNILNILNALKLIFKINF